VISLASLAWHITGKSATLWYPLWIALLPMKSHHFELLNSCSNRLKFRTFTLSKILFSRLLSNHCLEYISSRISRWRLALSLHVHYKACKCRAVKAVISGNRLLFHRYYVNFILFSPKMIVKLTSYSSWLLVTVVTGQVRQLCLLQFHHRNWITEWHNICTSRELTNVMMFSRKPAKNHPCFEIRKVPVSVN